MTGRKFHRTKEVIPRRPWKSKTPFLSRPTKTSIKYADARGACEVQHSISSIHFHCTVHRRPVISVIEKQTKKETHKQIVRGVLPGFWVGILFMCSSPRQGMTRTKKHINRFWPSTQSWDNPPSMLMCFSFPDFRRSR